MTKCAKGITLAIAPFKTVHIETTEKDSFEECDKALIEELKRMPAIEDLNEADIKKVFPKWKKVR